MKRVEHLEVEKPKGNLVVGFISGHGTSRHILTNVSGFMGYGGYDYVGGQTRHYQQDVPSYAAAVALCGRKTPKEEAGVTYEKEQIDISDSTMCSQCMKKWLERKDPMLTVFQRERIQ